MTSINSDHSINYLNGVTFRAKPQETQPVSKPLSPQPNVSFKGTEALAAYNYNLVNKNTNFDIPLVTPIAVPENIEDVKGERIYNSTGDLVEIVDEDENYRYVYLPESEHEKYTLSVFDKKTNRLVKSQCEWKSDNGKPEISVREFVDSNTIYYTEYDKKTLKPNWLHKNIKTEKETINVNYRAKHGDYSVSVHDKTKNVRKYTDYDKNKNIIRESIEKEYPDRFKNIEKPQLHPKIELNYDPKRLDGDKKYYSNGTIEKITANENGKNVVYNFNTNGTLKNIEKDNLKISYYENDEYCTVSHSIEENLGNGKSRTTYYKFDGTTRFELKDGDNEQHYYFDKNGNIINYYEVIG